MEKCLGAQMTLKPDRWIRKMAVENKMIEPFVDTQICRVGNEKVISYGLSSYGYDLRVGPHFKVFTNAHCALIDPKHFRKESFIDIENDTCTIPPNSFALAASLEYFRIPRNILTICMGKSTYARCGVIVNVTPLEPDWEGYVTLEISNTTPLPVVIYAHEGIAQVLFLEANQMCETSYADRAGKYMKQVGITVPLM